MGKSVSYDSRGALELLPSNLFQVSATCLLRSTQDNTAIAELEFLRFTPKHL